MISVNQNNKIPRGYIVGRITALKPKEISEMHARQDSEEKIDDLGMNDTVKMKIETKEQNIPSITKLKTDNRQGDTRNDERRDG